MEISRIDYHKKSQIIDKINKIRQSCKDVNRVKEFKTTAFNIDSSLRNKNPKKRNFHKKGFSQPSAKR